LLLAALQRYDRERPLGVLGATVRTFELVPIAYYVMHLLVPHTPALLVARVTGQPDEWLGWAGTFAVKSPPTYGYGLSVVYLAAGTQ
jgi:hypothetical protein